MKKNYYLKLYLYFYNPLIFLHLFNLERARYSNLSSRGNNSQPEI